MDKSLRNVNPFAHIWLATKRSAWSVPSVPCGKVHDMLDDSFYIHSFLFNYIHSFLFNLVNNPSIVEMT